MLKRGNIFLVGMMGAGKTTIGKLLARHLHKMFIDVDQEIERRTGVKIPLIFELEGESGFRARESRVLEDLVRLENIVLATGGGAVLGQQNRENLCRNGTIVYLKASIDDLWQRTRHDKTRPLLQAPDPKGKLEDLLVQRDSLYHEVADITINSGKQSALSIARLLEKQLMRI